MARLRRFPRDGAAAARYPRQRPENASRTAPMDHPLIDLINARIAKAEAEGAFENLPGAGKPLPDCDDPENAVLNRILKDNGAVPQAVALSRQLSALREELRETSDRDARRRLIQDMSLLEARLEIERKSR